MKAKLLLLAVVLLLAAGGAELLLRRLDPPPRWTPNAAEDLFWRRSPELGWDHRPGASGAFTNGYFRGEAHFDADGVRQNSAAGTRLPDAPEIFVIGDSTTASLEVDDDETVPARLEQALRRSGRRVNVRNLGVRGYGTDQAVRRAIALAASRAPVEIVYLFTDNDPFDNLILHQPARRYGKGSYVRGADGRFAPLRWPVPEDDPAYFGVVVPDGDRPPRVLEGTIRVPAGSELSAAPGRFAALVDRFATGRALRRLHDLFVPSNELDRRTRRWRREGVRAADLEVDPRVDTVPFFAALFWASVDGGLLREREQEYFAQQFEELLGLLRTIPGPARVHLVRFPSEATLRLLREHRPSTNAALAERLRQKGLIDDEVDLNEELLRDHRRLAELECPGDAHFCEAGNLWISGKILERTGLGAALARPAAEK